MKKILLVYLIAIMCVTPVYASDKAPKIEAIGAVMIDYETGRVLWGKNEHEPLSMASTTKIMTALLTLERADLNDIVTVSKRAASTPEVNINLMTGEKLRLEDLLYALMLQSANDAAVAIAEHVSGSVEEFCRQMTIRASELGALDTVFETPNGLDAGQHHSTAYDMAMITRAALGNSAFVRITNTLEATFSSDRREFHMMNRNRLLREYDGATGVKTGFTGKAGHCFAGAAKRGDMQLISVVLASGWGNKGKEQKWVDTKRLLDYGFANFEYQEIISEHAWAKTISVERSKTPELALYYENGLRLPLTEAERMSVRVAIEAPESIIPPIEAGDCIGMAHVYLGQNLYTGINLVTAEGATRHDFETSLRKVLAEWFDMAGEF